MRKDGIPEIRTFRIPDEMKDMIFFEIIWPKDIGKFVKVSKRGFLYYEEVENND